MMQREGMEVEEACRWAQVSRAGFYRHYTAHAPLEADVALRTKIQEIALNNRFYGYRSIAHELAQQYGLVVNRKRVLRLMRADNLLVLRKRRFVLTTDSRHTYAVYPNIAASLCLQGINQLWVSDITYIRLRESFVYLAVILDAFSRRVVGWQLADHLRAELVVAALDRALADRVLTPGIVHHSDRGVQYCADEYVSRLRQHGFTISMSRKANPYDNARAESFMKTLKQEEVYLHQYRDLEEARALIGQFLEQVYNRKRRHSALDYLAPCAFESNLPGQTAFENLGWGI